MTTLLLDANVLLAAFDPEDGHHELARALLENDEVTLATLDLARYEITNVAVRARRPAGVSGATAGSGQRLADGGGVLLSTDTPAAADHLLARIAGVPAQGIEIVNYLALARDVGLKLVATRPISEQLLR